MKLIIIEGTDRVGKDLMCDYIKDNYVDSNFYRHWGFPPGITNQDKIDFQKMSFKKEFDLYSTISKDNYFLNSPFIWNRSHLGEYVYGKMYRDYDPEWIFNLESVYGFDQRPEIYLVLLTADAEFICSVDDGESFTTDIQKKEEEIQRFNQAYDLSIIPNKLKIKVNEKDSYRDLQRIREEFNSFILN